jgi:hypothetical protein
MGSGAMTEKFDDVCQECGTDYNQEDADGYTFRCNHCGLRTCENCGSGGLCTSCDTDNMAGCLAE